MTEKKFSDPLLGVCEFEFFYITNHMYGGYSAKCDKGRISVDYADANEVIDTAQKAGMWISLAGSRWKEIGREGFGEQVAPVIARALITKLRTVKRGVV